MNTWHIHIEGQVQGVGFRPFVFKLAKEYGFNGWVNNTTDGVHIEVNATRHKMMHFCKALLETPPPLSCITAHTVALAEQKTYDDFQIVHSDTAGKRKLLLTPDFGMCEDCKGELYALGNARYDYPFITCTNCGPRYSIIHQLPYDRGHTAMERFSMCPTCLEEYGNPLDRRYYSQTNSCPACPVTMTLFDAGKNQIETRQEQIVEKVVKLWKEGEIVAIKGIGGYLLTCDARNETTLSTLRKRKHRPSKPFALMYPDVTFLEDIQVRVEESEQLQNQIAPIVLLGHKEKTTLPDQVAPRLNQLGIMLPYTPLYDLLLKTFGQPIVATSGNVSNSPIVFQDEKALDELSEIADYILVNDRGIVVPQDDSVIRFTSIYKQKIVLRRSRGLAPTYINADLQWADQCILAMGAMLKSTFSFLHKGNTYVSQYLGDLDHFDTQQNFRQVVEHFLQLFEVQPEMILCDKHPEYPSTEYGKNKAATWGVPVQLIQHHLAHFGAVLGENNLLDAAGPVLGVIWDGTGLGDDGQIWGGEFFRYDNYHFRRSCHFSYFDFILGDKMPREPRISALSACWEVEGAADLLKEKFSEAEWRIYNKLLEKDNPLQTSSMGRLFDAVASLLGIMDKQTYEGEAAMLLEAMATRYVKGHGLAFSSDYFDGIEHDGHISTRSLMSNLVRDLQRGETKDRMAARFHFSLVKSIKVVAIKQKIKKIAFSGGVFQNGLLVDLIVHHLKGEFDLYFHRELSPNDECVSFGQLVCQQITEKQN